MIKHFLSIALISIAVFMSGCTYYPQGMTEYSDYLSLRDNVGILARMPGQEPMLVFAQQFGIQLLVDERILGSWLLQRSSVPNIVLSSDGTAHTTTPSLLSRSGTFQWVGANIVLITYTDGTYDIMRFFFDTDTLALIQIVPHDSDEPIVVLAVKIEDDKVNDAPTGSIARVQ